MGPERCRVDTRRDRSTTRRGRHNDVAAEGLIIDEYLDPLPASHRAALEQIRATVHATVPGLTERISYGIPTFDLNGPYVVYMAARKSHASLYPVTETIIDVLGSAIAPYVGGKAR